MERPDTGCFLRKKTLPVRPSLPVVLAVATAVALLAWGATGQPTITAAMLVGNKAAGVAINPSTNPSHAADPVVWAQDCSTTQPGTTRVTFLWTPSGAGLQWLDLSLFDNGFPPGYFVGVGPLPPEAWGFVWDGLQPGATHYLRLNTLSQGGWQSSGTLAFATIPCGPDMAVQQSCSPTSGLVDVTFRWYPRLLSGMSQWIDLSVLDNGFVPGTFISAGPLSPVASSFQWTGLRPGLLHYWRVNTLTSVAGWVPSQTVSFKTVLCTSRLPATPASTPASALATYRSDQFGFEFQYRSECRLTEQPDGASEIGGASVYLSVTVGSLLELHVSDPGGLSLADYVKRIADELEASGASIEPISQASPVGGAEAMTVRYRFGGLGRYGEATFFERNGRIYDVGFTAGAFTCSEPQVYEGILSTFRFTRESTIVPTP